MYKKKSLGQHFLNPNWAPKVAEAAALVPGELVVEVGPGEGVLTRELLKRGARVVAVEKDQRLVPLLNETFAASLVTNQLAIIEADALEFDPPATALPGKTYKVVANIPYYITGALLRRFFSAPRLPGTIVLLIQKEVAERIARSKKESILSLSVKAYGEPRYLQTVPRGAFSPPPQVDSAILCITGISRDNFIDREHEQRFFELLHAGFGQKRKLLRRNLEAVLGREARAAMQKAGIPEDARAEDVPVEKWVALSSL